jgi:exonuclease 1
MVTFLKKIYYKMLRFEGISCFVAPYEVDAQLAFLFHQKIVDIILTEDSDLAAFGVQKVIFFDFIY